MIDMEGTGLFYSTFILFYFKICFKFLYSKQNKGLVFAV